MGPDLGPCQLGSLGPCCTTWANDQHSPAGLEPQPVTAPPLSLNLRYNRPSGQVLSGGRWKQIQLSASAGPSSSGRTALLTPLTPLDSTGPSCPV